YLPAGSYHSVPYWSASDWTVDCALGDDGTFSACAVPPPRDVLLRGLAVTSRHYLAVGYIARERVGDPGLLIFDLHRGGPPLTMRWPADKPFSPWDIAATDAGGVLVLDCVHATYWLLDRDFRLRGDFRLWSDSLPSGLDPVAIEPGPHDTV